MTSTTTTVRKSYGSRKISTCADDYYRLLKPKNVQNAPPKKSEDVAKLVKYIDDNIIGKNNAFVGPFGRRKAAAAAACAPILTKAQNAEVEAQNPLFGRQQAHKERGKSISDGTMYTCRLRNPSRRITRTNSTRPQHANF